MNYSPLNCLLSSRLGSLRQRTAWILGALSLITLTACNSTPPSPESPSSGSETPGTSMDGHSMDGHSMGGHSMGGHSLEDMNLGPQDGELALRFLDAMVLHHQGAIAMAEAALTHSSRSEIKTLAQAIITAQQKEIAQMQEWRKTWYPQAAAAPLMYQDPPGQTAPMDEATQADMAMNQDLGTGDDQFDRRFMDAMIPHHEGAIIMAQQILSPQPPKASPPGSSAPSPAPLPPELLTLAQDIIDAQGPEIAQMQQWRQDWYGLDSQ